MYDSVDTDPLRRYMLRVPHSYALDDNNVGEGSGRRAVDERRAPFLPTLPAERARRPRECQGSGLDAEGGVARLQRRWDR